jgi:ABC-type phosphate transport system auxiliary subunit
MPDANAERLVEANVQLLRAHRRHKITWTEYLQLLRQKHDMLRNIKNNLSVENKSDGKMLRKQVAKLEEARSKSLKALKDIASLQEEIMELELLHDLDSQTFKIGIGSRYNTMYPNEPIKLEANAPLVPSVATIMGIPAA